MVDYFDTRFFFDLLACLPIDYFLLIFGVPQQTVAWVRAFRILKLYKPLDYIQTWRKHSNVKIALFTLFLMSVLFVVIAHVMGCIFFFIGRHEVGQNRRYDGQSLFENTIDRDFLTLDPVMEMSIIEQYVHFFYLSACTMGAVMYGDLIPLTLSEQFFGFVAMFVARIYLAFLYAEAAAYLSSVHSAYSNHVRVRSTIIKYLELHSLPQVMKKRVYKYHEILWDNFKGINENEILSDLPESIQKQIKFSLFSDLIENVTLFPKDDQAAISALISRLELQLISEGEYVIRDGEIANCMYFILRGSINVMKDGVILATLEQGSHFGEMALAERKPTIRTASALCITPVSVGYLSITNFNIICGSYPIFEAKITEEVDKRKKDLIDKTKNIEKLKDDGTSRRKSSVISNKKMIAKKRQSALSSQKGSRQSAYEVEPNEEGVKPRFGSQLNVFDGPRPDNADLSGQNTLDINKRSSVGANIDQHQSFHKLNDSNSSMVVRENPNDPDSAIIADNNVYHGDVRNFLNDEESEEISSEPSIKRSKRSGNNKEGTVKSSEDDGEAQIKVSKNKYVWLWKLLSIFSLMNVYKCILLSLILYNVVFIPLQAAFRYDYNPGYIVMELFTLIFYMIDLVLIIKSHQDVSKRLQELIHKDPSSDKHLWRSIDDEKKDLRRIKVYILLSIISWIPFSPFFSLLNSDRPFLLLYYIRILRLMKIRPLLNVFSHFKQRSLNATRIIEMLILYYIACHIIACSFINIAYTQEDITQTWLRRIPVPQATGMRSNDFHGLSNTSIYIHALNFTVNTVSHVAIGDITAVTYQERIYNALIILCGTFIYAFLFGNVASIMADFAPQMFFFKFHKQFEDVMSSLNRESVPAEHISKIKDYFDYVWANSKGISYEEILGGLPHCLNADILFARYSEAINNSIIFKDEDNEVNQALTNSILTVLEYRVYMDGDFIITGGSSSKNTYVIVEGEAIIMGLNEEFIAFIKSGGHYSNDLEPNDPEIHEYKRPLHIISKGISIVGILSIDKLEELYIAYPDLKTTLRVLNKHFAQYITKF